MCTTLFRRVLCLSVCQAFAVVVALGLATSSLAAQNPIPILNSVSPSSPGIAFVGLTVTLNGSGFIPQSVARLNGTPLTTFFVSSTVLAADIDAPQSTLAGIYTLTVENPAPGGGVSIGVTITLQNPVPSISSLMPSALGLGILAGSGNTFMTLSGGIFAQNATIRVNGSAIPTTYVDRFTLTATIPAASVAVPGNLALTVENPAPGGGVSAAFNVNIVGPSITSVFGSAVPVPVAPTTSGSVFLSGSNFSSSAVIYADGALQSTIQIDSNTVRFTLSPSLPGTQQRGAIILTVENPGGVLSNSFPLEVGGAANNTGTLRRNPIAPMPGQSYGILLEGGRPNALFTLIVDAANPTPTFPFVNATTNFVLAIRPFNTGGPLWFTLVDGLGLAGPSTGTTFGANGQKFLGSFPLPAAPLGLDLSLQAAYLDPTAPGGFQLTWARTESL